MKGQCLADVMPGARSLVGKAAELPTDVFSWRLELGPVAASLRFHYVLTSPLEDCNFLEEGHFFL